MTILIIKKRQATFILFQLSFYDQFINLVKERCKYKNKMLSLVIQAGYEGSDHCKNYIIRCKVFRLFVMQVIYFFFNVDTLRTLNNHQRK